MSGRWHHISDLLSLFGPAATASVIKNGGTAEAGRREVQAMEAIAQINLKENDQLAAAHPSELRVLRMRADRWLNTMIERAQDAPVTEVVNLTPALAQALLARNPQNRKLSLETVERYARDIATGRWDFNGTSIVVSLNGETNDGQHRCHAVIKANRSITVVIVFGPDRDSRFTLDQNKVRTVGDYLGMKGYGNGNVKGAVATYVYQYRKLKRLSQQHLYRPTKAESLSIVSTHPELEDSVSAVPSKGHQLVGGKSLLAFCHWVFAKRDKVAATAFIKSLVSGGGGMEEGDPILYARNRLMSTQGKNMRPGEKAELIFRAWNAHRLGQRPKTLIVNGEDLPAVEG